MEALEALVCGSIRNDENTVLFVYGVHESSDSFNIVCAGSLLGVTLKRFSSSFPMGMIIVKNMYPLDFEEFLWATHNDRYIPIIHYFA